MFSKKGFWFQVGKIKFNHFWPHCTKAKICDIHFQATSETAKEVSEPYL